MILFHVIQTEIYTGSSYLIQTNNTKRKKKFELSVQNNTERFGHSFEKKRKKKKTTSNLNLDQTCSDKAQPTCITEKFLCHYEEGGERNLDFPAKDRWGVANSTERTAFHYWVTFCLCLRCNLSLVLKLPVLHAVSGPEICDLKQL